MIKESVNDGNRVLMNGKRVLMNGNRVLMNGKRVLMNVIKTCFKQTLTPSFILGKF